MAAKTIFFLCAQALMIQAIVGQVIRPGSTVSGNTVVENDIYIGNVAGLAGLGIPGISNSGLVGLGSVGLGSVGSALGSSYGLSDLNIVSSGPLVVTSISPIGPSGIAVASENAIEGNLLVSGTLPFLSAVAFEGALPSAGSGVATCGCGTGSVGIISEGLPQTLPTSLYGIGSGIGGVYY